MKKQQISKKMRYDDCTIEEVLDEVYQEIEPAIDQT